MKCAASLVLGSLIVAGCVSAPIDSTVVRPEDTDSTVLRPIVVQPGDVVQVLIMTTESQDLQCSVDAEGRITLPFIGNVTISGQTADQVVETLLKLYDKDHYPGMSIKARILGHRREMAQPAAGATGGPAAQP